MAVLFTVWMDAISSHPVLLRAAREMVKRTGILEVPGNNSHIMDTISSYPVLCGLYSSVFLDFIHQ